MGKMTDLYSETFKAYGLPEPVREFKFHPTRRWRFDFCWPQQKLAVELNGACFTQGRHTRGAGFVKDMQKLNAAQELGWVVLQYQTNTKKIDYNQVVTVYRKLFNKKEAAHE
jgi:very-short-patch-repair endonuclease